MILLMIHDVIEEAILSKIYFKEKFTSEIASQMQQIRS